MSLAHMGTSWGLRSLQRGKGTCSLKQADPEMDPPASLIRGPHGRGAREAWSPGEELGFVPNSTLPTLPTVVRLTSQQSRETEEVCLFISATAPVYFLDS